MVTALNIMYSCKQLRVPGICSKVVGESRERSFLQSCTNTTLRLADEMAWDSSHVLHEEFQLLPSRKHFRVPSCQKNKFKISLILYSILLLGQKRKRRCQAQNIMLFTSFQPAQSPDLIPVENIFCCLKPYFFWFCQQKLAYKFLHVSKKLQYITAVQKKVSFFQFLFFYISLSITAALYIV